MIESRDLTTDDADEYGSVRISFFTTEHTESSNDWKKIGRLNGFAINDLNHFVIFCGNYLSLRLGSKFQPLERVGRDRRARRGAGAFFLQPLTLEGQLRVPPSCLAIVSTTAEALATAEGAPSDFNVLNDLNVITPAYAGRRFAPFQRFDRKHDCLASLSNTWKSCGLIFQPLEKRRRSDPNVSEQKLMFGGS